jgi:hypothetical protein
VRTPGQTGPPRSGEDPHAARKSNQGQKTKHRRPKAAQDTAPPSRPTPASSRAADRKRAPGPCSQGLPVSLLHPLLILFAADTESRLQAGLKPFQ